MLADPDRPGRAIVTYSRSWQALSAIRSLGRRGVEVIAADEVLITPGSLSRYAVERFEYPSPSTDPEGFLDAVSDAVDRYRPLDPEEPYVLMPIHNEGYVLARERQRFEGRIALPLAPAKTFERVQHKRRLIELAEEVGIAHPKTWTPESLDELEQCVATLRFPVFLKMPQFSSGVGVSKIESHEELVAEFAELVERYQPAPGDMPILQARAEGEDYCTSGLWSRGKMHAPLSYRNVLTFPREHGPGVVRETVAAPHLERIAERLLGHVGWHGMAQLDFRWSGREQDEPMLIEVNPRFFGGLFHAIQSGVDYPWLLFRLALGSRIAEPDNVEVGVRTEAPITGLLATVAEVLEHDSKLEELEQSWDVARQKLEGGAPGEALRKIFDGLRASIDVAGRLDHVRQVLEENSQNVSMLLDEDDPLPVLGLVYPLAIFVRHGALSADVLTGASGGRAS
jgi:predicted ATP-grasp superfamily ATP-dependent carboligase